MPEQHRRKARGCEVFRRAVAAALDRRGLKRGGPPGELVGALERHAGRTEEPAQQVEPADGQNVFRGG
jgi:hypothetical protein